MMRKNDDGYILSTGRQFSDAAGGIGIDNNLTLYAGHDSEIDTDGVWGYGSSQWTLAEKIELADYMLALWNLYRQSAIVPTELKVGDWVKISEWEG
jgi:hypothetical protein